MFFYETSCAELQDRETSDAGSPNDYWRRLEGGKIFHIDNLTLKIRSFCPVI